MRLEVRQAPDADYGWLIQRSGFTPTYKLRALEAVDSKGNIRGMVGYDNPMPNAVQMHMAFESPIALRALLRPGFEWAFNIAGKGTVLGWIPAGNEKSVNLTRRLGFREAHRIRDAIGPGEDLIQFEMRREECRFLGGTNG